MKHSIFIITSYILLLVPCFSTTLPPLEEQNKLVKVIENTSWRGLKIANPPTEEFIEKKLLAKFSSLPQRFPKADFGSLIHKKDDIIQHLKIEGSPAQTQVAHYLIGAINKDYFTLSSATKMLNFQYMVQTIPDPLKTSFWATKDYGENISMEDSFITTNPRTQQRILNKRDLLVFKEKVEAYHSLNADTPIISHKNFEVDDVIKAASLCGTFCEVDEDDES